MRKQLSILIFAFLLTACFTFPANASLWGDSSLGQMHRKAAVVGKVIAYNQESNSYVVFGRLSIDNGTGYKVFETRKFYRVYPRWGGATDNLNKKLGQGVKIFGIYESSYGTGNEEKLLAEQVYDYDPETDRQAGMEPAFGSDIGPLDWVGFGVPLASSRVLSMDVNKSSDVISHIGNIRDELAPLLKKRSMNVADLANWIIQEPEIAAEKTMHNQFIKNIQPIWRNTWNLQWFLEKNLAVARDMQKAVKGTAFLYGLSGGVNGYVENVPVIRPTIDKFMTAAEKAQTGSFTEWAAPAVFYGNIYIQTPKYEEQKITVMFDGIYYSDKNPKEMVSAMAGQDSIKNKEVWRLEGLSEQRVKEVKNNFCWFSGQRTLVYRYCYTDSSGKTHCSLVEVYDGYIDDPDYTLVDYYIQVKKILTKDEYNLMMSLVRELALKGGI